MSKRRDFQNYLTGYQIHPNKALGQNFLYDENLLQEMAREMVPLAGARVAEIGAGTGNLTAALAEWALEVDAWEVDSHLFRPLQDRFASNERVHLHFGDVLQEPLETENRCWDYVVGNLPYYITTRLLIHSLLTAPQVRGYAFLLQKEAVQRLCAVQGKSYGPLPILIRACTTPRMGRILPAACFCPQPDVDSQILHLDAGGLLPEGDRGGLFAFLRQAFAQRRKMLSHAYPALQQLERALQGVPYASWLERADIKNLQIRPEAVTPEQWIRLFPSECYAKIT